MTTHPPIWIMSLNRLFFFFDVTPKCVILKKNSLLNPNSVTSNESWKSEKLEIIGIFRCYRMSEMICVSNFYALNSKNLNCPQLESLETAHEYNISKNLTKHGPILRIVILKRCLVWGSLQFEHSLIVPRFWWKSEFILIIALLHIIAHTWVEFKSKIEPLNSILRVL